MSCVNNPCLSRGRFDDPIVTIRADIVPILPVIAIVVNVVDRLKVGGSTENVEATVEDARGEDARAKVVFARRVVTAVTTPIAAAAVAVVVIAP